MVGSHKRFLAALTIAMQTYPTMRATQILVNALGEDPFYMEDGEAETLLLAYCKLKETV